MEVFDIKDLLNVTTGAASLLSVLIGLVFGFLIGWRKLRNAKGEGEHLNYQSRKAVVEKIGQDVDRRQRDLDTLDEKIRKRREDISKLEQAITDDNRSKSTIDIRMNANRQKLLETQQELDDLENERVLGEKYLKATEFSHRAENRKLREIQPG